jgi:hypothetical protein
MKEAAELELQEHTYRLLVPDIIAVMKGRDVEPVNTQRSQTTSETEFKVSCIVTSAAGM